MTQDKTVIPTDEQTPKETVKTFSQEEVNKIISERVNQLNAKHTIELESKEKEKEQVRNEALKELETSKNKLELVKDISDEDLKKLSSFKNSSDNNAANQVASAFNKPMPNSYEIEEDDKVWKPDISNV